MHSVRPRELEAPGTTGAGVALDGVMDLLLDAVCVVDADGCFVYVSAAFERIFGYTPAEVIGRPMLDLVYADDRERTVATAGEIMSGVAKTGFENRYVRKDGQVVHIMWSARWSESDRLRIAVARDVTDRKVAEARQAALYAISEAAHVAEDPVALFERIHAVIGELMPARNFMVALYDREADELSFPYHVDEHNAPPAPRKLDAGALSAEVIRTGQTLLLTPEAPTVGAIERAWVVDGRHSQYWLGVPLDSQNGTFGALAVQSYSGGARYSETDRELLHFVSAQIAAAVERQRLHARLKRIALYDSLTDLPNRPLLDDRLATALARAHREQGHLAVLYLDLDNFKQVNDQLGHGAGDQLLKEASRRIRLRVRVADTVARVGGDEFVVLLDSIAAPAHAELVAENIRLALNAPLELGGREVSILPSIGIAVYPRDGDTAQLLLSRADGAMYRAKKAGGNRSESASGAASNLRLP